MIGATAGIHFTGRLPPFLKVHLSMDFLDNLKKVPHNKCLNGSTGAHLARDVLHSYRDDQTNTRALHFVCSNDKEENHDH